MFDGGRSVTVPSAHLLPSIVHFVKKYITDQQMTYRAIKVALSNTIIIK